MVDWRIYYLDDSTVDNTQMTWEEAPQDGVIAVVLRDPEYGRLVLNGTNFYYSQVNGDEQDKALTDDINPQLRKRCPWLKFGVGARRSEWLDILIKATEDKDFPPATNPQNIIDDGKIQWIPLPLY